MEANKILKADILDLLFENRNKDYGAYELRRKYNKRISLAMGITAGIAGLIIGAAVLAKTLEDDEGPEMKKTEVVLEEVKQEEEEKPPPPPPPPPPKPIEPPKVELTKFTPPVIKEDKEVKQEEIPPQEELDNKNIDVINQEGEAKEIMPTVPIDDNKGVFEEIKEEPEDKIFEKVEIEASVDPRQWRRHLETQLQRYIEDAAAQGMSPGQYTVQVRFLVERDGSITDVSALNDPGYGLAKGAVDVVKKGPKWNPGEQNGRKVRSYHTQPITFVIAEE